MNNRLRSLAADAVRSLIVRDTPARRMAIFRTLVGLQRSSSKSGTEAEIDVRILGHRMRGFRGGSLRYLFDEIFLQNQYTFQSATPDPVIVDCGANVGFSLLYFKLQHPQARIVAFEANPQAFRLLQHNVAVNRLADVDLRHAAVSDSDGEIPFFINTTPGSLLASTRQDRGGEQRIMVACERLSTTLAALDRVDLVKIDVEGAEWAVLSDLLESGMLTKPANYIIEYHHQIVGEAARLSSFLTPFEDAGYRYQVAGTIKRPGAFQDVLLHMTRVGPPAPRSEGRRPASA